MRGFIYMDFEGKGLPKILTVFARLGSAIVDQWRPCSHPAGGVIRQRCRDFAVARPRLVLSLLLAD